MSELPKIDWKHLAPGKIIVGVDEVGRGCLAGPVVAGACVLRSDNLVDQLKDSKKISENQREKLAPQIIKEHWLSVAFASPEEIDELNILQASLLAMKRAVEMLEQEKNFIADLIVVDGTFIIPSFERNQKCFIQGDSRLAPISAAAIVAKVHRDSWMREIAKDYPQYGFEKHKGYASALHRSAIRQSGPCKWHRKSFGGVKEYISIR